MIFEQYQLPCLSLYSYLIGDESSGKAVVVDPQRDISQYLDEAGMVVPADADVIVAGETDRDRKAMIRLARIGFDRVVAAADYEGALSANPDAVSASTRIQADAVAGLDLNNVQLIDVRNPGETAEGTIPGAIEIPLGALARRSDEIDRSRPVVLYCQSGNRSSVAASWMQGNGFDAVTDVIGGYSAWRLLAKA